MISVVRRKAQPKEACRHAEWRQASPVADLGQSSPRNRAGRALQTAEHGAQDRAGELPLGTGYDRVRSPAGRVAPGGDPRRAPGPATERLADLLVRRADRATGALRTAP